MVTRVTCVGPNLHVVRVAGSHIRHSPERQVAPGLQTLIIQERHPTSRQAGTERVQLQGRLVP